ncbi:hypothetical protein [Vibrio phage S4-7]|nr:hypothetical protein [Vibrio phage S4-7]
MTIQITTTIAPSNYEGEYEEVQLNIERSYEGEVTVSMLDKTFDLETIQSIASHMEYLDKLPSEGDE